MSAAGRRRSRLAARLLALYPRAWRRRYGDEMADLVLREGLSPGAVLDLLVGALDAHINLPALVKGWCTMHEYLRRRVTLVFCAAALYAAAVYGLLETRDHVSFAASPAREAGAVMVALAWTATAVAGLLCVAAALAVAGVALARARTTGDWRPLRSAALPPAAALVALAWGAALGRLGGLGLGEPLRAALLASWVLVAALAAAVCVYAAARLLDAVPLPERLWRVLRLVSAAVAVSIAVGAAGLLAYFVALAAADSRLLSAHDGLLATPLLPTLLVVVAAGAVAAAVAATALRSGGPRATAPR
jgi:hypothetical protein